MRVGHIAGVDGLLVDGLFADLVEALAHDHRLVEGDALRRHQAARAVLRVFEDLVDLFARLAVRLQQDPLDDVRGHLLDQVDGIVHEQLIQHELELFIREGADQEFLLRAAHLDEGLGGELFGEQAKDDGDVLFV